MLAGKTRLQASRGKDLRTNPCRADILFQKCSAPAQDIAPEKLPDNLSQNAPVFALGPLFPPFERPNPAGGHPKIRGFCTQIEKHSALAEIGKQDLALLGLPQPRADPARYIDRRAIPPGGGAVLLSRQ